jgi:hypothetical protein
MPSSLNHQRGPKTRLIRPENWLHQIERHTAHHDLDGVTEGGWLNAYQRIVWPLSSWVDNQILHESHIPLQVDLALDFLVLLTWACNQIDPSIKRKIILSVDCKLVVSHKIVRNDVFVENENLHGEWEMKHPSEKLQEN